MNLQAHYQTFFTGVVVIGAVMLDMYRTRKTTEVKVLTPADQYKAEETARIAEKQEALTAAKAAGNQTAVAALTKEINSMKQEMKKTFRTMKTQEKQEAARILQEEKKAEQEFKERLKEGSHD
jgi:ribose transport system permease protein